MAERLLQRALGPEVQVRSAGLGALVQAPADPLAVALCQERGIDLTDHRAQQLTAALVAQHDLIFVMTQRQRQELTQAYPSVRGRVFLLCHWRPADVADPYQKDRAAFEAALTLIEQGVHDWAVRLNPLAEQGNPTQ